MQPENSPRTNEVIVSLVDDGVLLREEKATPIHIGSTLFRKHVHKLLRSNLQFKAEVRSCHSTNQPGIRLLVVSVSTSRKVAIAVPPAPEDAAPPILVDHPDVDACVVQNTWWPNLVAEGMPLDSLTPRYARVRGLRP